jgi:hypothetical protein
MVAVCAQNVGQLSGCQSLIRAKLQHTDGTSIGLPAFAPRRWQKKTIFFAPFVDSFPFMATNGANQPSKPLETEASFRAGT